MMGSMNARPAPDRCDPRAMRIAQVKFIALPLDDDDGPLFAADGRMVERRRAPHGTESPAPLFTILRNLLIRVIGRLEAARP